MPYKTRVRTVMRTATKKQPRYLPGINEIAGYIVGTGSGTKRPRTDSFIVTETEKKRKKAKRSYGAGQMAGFVKKGKKYRKGKRNQFAIKGVDLAKEFGGVCDAKRVAYVGHGSVPAWTARQMFWRAVCKRMFEKVYGTSPSTLGQSGVAADKEPFMRNTDKVTVVYSTGTGVANLYSDYVASADTSIETVVAWLSEDGRGYNCIGPSSTETFQLIEFLWVPANPSVSYGSLKRIRFIDAKIELYSKSSLKMQNRTINSAGNNESDDVDNQPLAGRSYEGKGSGMNLKVIQPGGARAGDYFHIVNTRGYVSYPVGNTEPNSLQEPPLPGDFGNVKRSGKIRFNPGDIKTSNLETRIKMDVQKFYKLIQNVTLSAQSITTLGEYRIFGLEKMIDTTGAADQPSIIVAWEVNYRMMAQIKEKYSKNTVQLYEYN